MADFIKMQVSGWDNADQPKNAVTNTVHFKRNALGGTSGVGAVESMVNDLWAIFNSATWLFAGCNRIAVKAYDMEDAPGPPIAQKEADCAARGSLGVREVAMCLSFRGDSNTPRTRGRIFCGPISENLTRSRRPDTTVRGYGIALAQSLADLGGVDIDWCVYSPTKKALGGSLGDSFAAVQAAWVDDAWDVVRSRGLPPTTRTNLALSE